MVGDDWSLSLDDFASCLAPDLELVQPKVNQFFVLQDGFCKARRLLARFNGTHVVPLKNANAEPYGIRAMGTTQRLMLESLITEKNEERMVVFEGHAGSGKTLLALASGLHQCGLGRFDRCFYIRSNVEADDTFGFLPGDISDKMDWLLGPVYDNLRILDSDAYYEAMGSSETGSATGKQQYLEKMGLFVCPLSHVRGRTLEKSFIIIDEAQNLSRDQVRMIVTRAGHGSTVVLIGDSSQIDTPRLSRFNNGLTHAFEAMDGEKLCYRLRLEAHDGKRSYLSRVAAQKL